MQGTLSAVRGPWRQPRAHAPRLSPRCTSGHDAQTRRACSHPRSTIATTTAAHAETETERRERRARLFVTPNTPRAPNNPKLSEAETPVFCTWQPSARDRGSKAFASAHGMGSGVSAVVAVELRLGRLGVEHRVERPLSMPAIFSRPAGGKMLWAGGGGETRAAAKIIAEVC